jgi:hypothetical protein
LRIVLYMKDYVVLQEINSNLHCFTQVLVVNSSAIHIIETRLLFFGVQTTIQSLNNSLL